MADVERQLLKLDYEETGRQHRALADVRFKLLAITPTLLGVGLFATLARKEDAADHVQTATLNRSVGAVGFLRRISRAGARRGLARRATAPFAAAAGTEDADADSGEEKRDARRAHAHIVARSQAPCNATCVCGR
jgi:hypothetical protein